METLSKIDLKKEDKAYYTSKQTPSLHEFGVIDYISISGVSAPMADLFKGSIEAIYAVAYTIKKYCKAEGSDFGRRRKARKDRKAGTTDRGGP